MTEQELRKLITEWAGYLITPPTLPNLNKVALLTTIATVESSLSKDNVSRYEPAYGPGGKIYNRSQLLQAQVTQYGRPAASSWSSWQIMYSTACECGYQGNPADLQNDAVAIKFIIKMINSRILNKQPTKMEDIFDAYNSGNFRDGIIPQGYIIKSIAIYNQELAKLTTETQGYLMDTEQGITDESHTTNDQAPTTEEPSMINRLKAWWNAK